jgi:hypothetical protein
VFLGTDLEASLLSFEKLDRASPDLWPEQCKFLLFDIRIDAGEPVLSWVTFEESSCNCDDSGFYCNSDIRD